MRLQKSLVQFMTRLHSLSLLLHLLALAMWLGGIAFFLIVFGPAVHELKPVLGLKLLNRGRMTFEALSWTAIGLLFLTGILNLVMRSQMTGAHLGNVYLTILSVKLLLFLAMLVHHALQVFKYGPKISALTNNAAITIDSWPEPLRTHWQKWFMFLKINATIGPIATLLGLALVRR
jgi:putative copper export protein